VPVALISYAQNGEDIRVWRALQGLDPTTLRYVDVGANDPRALSITASLYDLGWRGLLIEADPDLAAKLRVHRPGDQVVQAAVAATAGHLEFHRVPGTGLGTLDTQEAAGARSRGFAVEVVAVQSAPLSDMLDTWSDGPMHFMTIDVEGGEADALAGLDLRRHRPWILCIEAVSPGTSEPSHAAWEPSLLAHDYEYVTFDGVNRWYVAAERPELIEPVKIPFNAIDAGAWGWIPAEQARLRVEADRAVVRHAWQRELIENDRRAQVPVAEYERQITELRDALIHVEGSRSFLLARALTAPARRLRGWALARRDRLPAPVRHWMVRRRHLRHVTVNMGHLTPPSMLGRSSSTLVDWLTPDGLPSIPEGGIDPQAFGSIDESAVRAWLAQGPWDDDVMLERRVDGHDDELGRTVDALRVRLSLHERASASVDDAAGGDLVLIDARCLQAGAFAARGIGRFARAVVQGTRAAVGDQGVHLLIDRGLAELPPELVGDCRLVTGVSADETRRYGALVQPSPMTATPAPLVHLLGRSVLKLAVVYDFIPLHFPDVYLRSIAARAEYGATLDALRRYDEFVCISGVVAGELRSHVPAAEAAVYVAWPADLVTRDWAPGLDRAEGPIVIMTGDDPRKNTFGGLAAAGAATAHEPQREIVVLGMAGQDDRVHHWSIAAMMRPGETRTAQRLTDTELSVLLKRAGVVVVPSFDEGLSLPVIEALAAGAPVVASDIPSHRELMGSGPHLADPGSPRDLARAIARGRGRSDLARRQRHHLAQHRHQTLEVLIGERLGQRVGRVTTSIDDAVVHAAGRDPRIAIAGPWVPQRTGVADFTTTTTLELARLADVRVYTTSGADVPASIPPGVRLAHGSVDELARRGHDADVLVSVVGNSHFHLPFIDLLRHHCAAVVTHDTRMAELYLALRSPGGLADLMLRRSPGGRVWPGLADQIEDLRLLQDLGLWEIARRARLLIAHTPTAAHRMSVETGVDVHLLPFANQRVPQVDAIDQANRLAARTRLGLRDDVVNIGSFGYVDLRSKLADVVLESAAWLRSWGHPVHLHLIGMAPTPIHEQLVAQARAASVDLTITGFADEGRYRDYLLAIDLAVQLRISPVLGVSGPLSDLSAFGTPAVASRGLAEDVGAPGYVTRLPDHVSPLLVAEAVETSLATALPANMREEMRRAYLTAHSPARYARSLLDLLVAGPAD